MVDKGITLGQLNRSEESIVVFDAVVTRFGDREEAAPAEQVAQAMVNKGFTLGQLSRSEKEIGVCDAVVTRFGDRKEAALAERVAKAMGRLIGASLESGNITKVRELAGSIIGQFEHYPEFGIQRIVELAKMVLQLPESS